MVTSDDTVTISVANPRVLASGLTMQKYVDYEVRLQVGYRGISSVRRRFNDFKWVHEKLTEMGYRHFTLPSGHLFGSLNSEYDNSFALDTRRSQLERYLRDIVAHPACLREEPLQMFLEADDAAFATAKIDTMGLTRYFNRPLKFYLEEEIQKATYTLLNFTSSNPIEGEDSIPIELLQGCAGIAFLTVVKAGFFFSARVGSGLVVARTPDGSWSAPSAIGAGGAGWGFQIGGEVTDMVIVLSDVDAVNAFCSDTQLSMGTELSMSLGPIGRSAETNLMAGNGGACTVFSYAHSKGLFVGVSLQAGVITARPDVNITFYGEHVAQRDLLSGHYPRPEKADPLYRALAAVYQQPHFRPHPISSANSQLHVEADFAYAQTLQREEDAIDGMGIHGGAEEWEQNGMTAEEWARERHRRLNGYQKSAEAVVQEPQEMGTVEVVRNDDASRELTPEVNAAVATPVTVATPEPVQARAHVRNRGDATRTNEEILISL